MVSILDLLRRAYDRVYFTKELRAQEGFALSLKKVLHESESLSTKTTAQRIHRFFGIPDRKVNKKIILKTLKDLANWDTEKYSLLRNLLQSLIIFPINLALVICKFALNLALNVAKLFTEFLPHFIAKLSLEGCKSLLKLVTSKKTEQGQRFLSVLVLIVLVPLTAVSHLVYFVGCATTSPADTFRSAFATGDELAGGGFPGKVVGGIFALLSAFTTACVYAILFPLAIKLLITQAPAVLPAIADGLSQFIGIFSVQAGASVATFFSTTLPGFFSSVGVVVSSVVTPVLSAFTLSLSQLGATTVLAGLAGVVGIAVGGVITPVVAVTDKIDENMPDGEEEEARCIRLMGISDDQAQKLEENATKYGEVWSAKKGHEKILREEEPVEGLADIPGDKDNTSITTEKEEDIEDIKKLPPSTCTIL